MSVRKIGFTLILAALVMGACAPAATPEPTPIPPTNTPEPTAMPESQTIVDLAVADGRFTTLVGALQATGLDAALAGEGSFTVFAPTDDAFAALPEGTLDALSEEELTNILLYHVLEGEVVAADVAGLDGESVATLLGESVEVSVDGSTVQINDATVIITDIMADNGVIHVIESVLLPPSMATADMSIVDIAVEDGRFTTLVGALEATGLDATLAGEGDFTVFAPTDDAFAALPEGTLAALTTEQLTDILLYHVLDGRTMAADVLMLSGEQVPTVLGESVDILVEGDRVFVNGAEVIIVDIEAANGVIHVIDAVLLPPSDA